MRASIDLFTGIGGFVQSLHSDFTPMMYCDSSPIVKQLLIALMNRNVVPQAPIVDDVKNVCEMREIVADRRVDMITAGFPCVGFSSVGRRKGLSDERSALFFYVIRVIEEFKPDYVIFENVARIVNSNNGDDLRRILETMDRAGYDCKWTTCNARDVGLPQLRKRWFCLCTRRGAQDLNIQYIQHDVPPMPNLLAMRQPDYVSRYFVLGNTIIPAVARFALGRLCSDITSNMPSKLRGHGTFTKGIIKYISVNVNTVPSTPYTIVLSPLHYSPVYKRHNLQHRSQPIVEDIELHNWPTPRATAPRHSNSLTVRNTKDLPTVALFAARVQGTDQVKPIQGMSVNPQFLEWLMGYPVDYTKQI